MNRVFKTLARCGLWAAVAGLTALAACGGGGDDGPAPYRLSFNPGTLKATALAGTSQPMDVVVSSDRTIGETFNVAVVDRAGVISPSLALTALNQTTYSATLFTASSLAAGRYSGTLEVRLCRDNPAVCASPLPGSPWSVPYDITVTVNDPVGRFTSAPFDRDAPVDEMAAFNVAATIAGGTQPTYPQLRDSGHLFQPNPPTTYQGGALSAQLFLKDGLAAGTYEGQVEMLLCKDLPCSQQFSGSPVRLPYKVVVQSAANLSVLQRWPGVGEWAQYQANMAHTGHVPVTLDPTRFNRRWRWSMPGAGTNIVQLHPVVTGDGLLYAVGSGYFQQATLFALDENDASLRWQHGFGSVPAANPPATDGGLVFMATSGHSDTYMWAFNADGTLHFRTAFSAQWEHYFAPTIFNGQVFSNGGYYGGMVSFDIADGQVRWATGLAQYDQWTPAIGGGHALTFLPDGLSALNLATGTVAFTIPDPNASIQPYSVFGAPMVTSNGQAVVINGALQNNAVNRLVAFDLSTRSIRWSIPGSFTLAPAAAPGVIYVVNGAQLEARRESDGTRLWGWLPPEATTNPFSVNYGSTPNNIVATDNLVFVSTGTATYAVDTTTRQVVWTYPKPGRLALSPNGVLYLVLNGSTAADSGIVAFNLR